MLKVRIMPTLLYKDTTLVKGVSFDSWRRIGYLMQAIKVYNIRQVDELVFMDITATKQSRAPDFNLVDDFADDCFMPLTVGGGIKTIDDVRKLLAKGADKVSVCTSAVINPSLISNIASEFGSQCVVVSIDVKKHENGIYEVFTESGTKPSGLDPLDFAIEMENRNAGEILLTSIDRDGTMSGYDIDLIKSVANSVSIPVIASGGAGNYQHMLEAIKIGNADAVAASSIFHFTEQTPLEAKYYLKDKGINVRLYK
ncbi:MAG: imidazole glycerol phosphate synthase subunit HisF [Candidatus Lokiarchaeota archaeon]|nr:imidazole glycerol phosphate synthase subunit HisF [Candidatus Lokiarchaeota archaeon]